MDAVRIGKSNPVNTRDLGKDATDKADKVTKIEVQNIENQVEKKDAKPQPEQLKSAVDTANKMLFKNNTHLKFEIHDKTQEIMVRVVKDDTGEVIREIPAEKMLDMVAKMWETLGILVDEKR